MSLTKAQQRLVDTHAYAYDTKAAALKKLGLTKYKNFSTTHLVSCDFDRSLRRTIHGVCSTPQIIDDNKSFLSRGCVLKVPIDLLYEHNPQGGPVGRIHFMAKTPKQITIAATIFDNAGGDLAWLMIQNGELTGLSCGFSDLHMLAKIDGVEFFNRFRIKEVSLCRSPKNPDCSFRFEEERD